MEKLNEDFEKMWSDGTKMTFEEDKSTPKT